MEIIMNELVKCYRTFAEISDNEVINIKDFLTFVEESIGVFPSVYKEFN